MKKLLYIIIAILIFISVACGSSSSSDGNGNTSDDKAIESKNDDNTKTESANEDIEMSLESTKWSLVLLNTNKLIDSTSITLSFSDDEMSGNASCNSYSGEYELDEDDGEIKFGDIMNTSMGCMKPEGILQQESEYLKTLRQVNKYKLEKEKLVLMIDDKSVLEYEIIKPPKNAKLTDGKWKLITFAIGEMAFTPYRDFEFIIEFKDGKVTAKNNCNKYSGNYKLDGEDIQISIKSNDGKKCEKKEHAENEKDFLDIVNNAKAIKIEADRLSIIKKNDDYMDFELIKE